MKKNKFKCKKNYLNLKKFEKINLSCNYLYKNLILNKGLRQKCFFFFTTKKNWKTKYFPYCLITGRTKGLVKYFQVSRQTFKELIKMNKLFGVKKKSW